MEAAIVLALGTRGDVQPLLALAIRLRESIGAVDFVTHRHHQSWLEEPCAAQELTLRLLDSPPARVWSQGSAGQPAASTQDEQREQCLVACEAALQAGEGPGRQVVMVCSLFSLEAFSIAEAAGVPCIVASPCLAPYAAPASFQPAFERAHPALFARLMAEEGGGSVSWSDVKHWQWPLFGERWGAWRHHRLGLPPAPYSDCPPDRALPPPTLLLYGISPALVPPPSYWPASVQLTGAWHDRRCFPAAAAALPEAALRCDRPVAVDFGSMGRLGLIPAPARLAALLWAAAELTGRTIVLLTGGWEPLQDAAAALLADRGGTAGGAAAPPLIALAEAVPHDVLLPRCAALLHHGGAGTVAAALRCGTPQLICPLHFDQGQWAERIAWAGLGARLPTHLLFPPALPAGEEPAPPLQAAAALATALSSLLADAGVRRECRQMCEEGLEGEDGAGAAAAAILGVLRAAPLPAQQRGEEGGGGQGCQGQPGDCPAPRKRQQQGRRPPLPLALEEVTLPNGLALSCPSPSEALFIYREIWEERCYLRHGLTLAAGATVVSAGSNIGLFELWLLQAQPGEAGGGGRGGGAASGMAPPQGLLGAPGRVWAFEPVPQLADCLEANLRRYGVGEKVAVVRAGLFSRPCTLPLTVYPRMPGNSTASPAEKWDHQRPAMLAGGMRPAAVEAAFGGARVQACAMVTLADFVGEQGIDCIDLLKVDVEGAELEVLHGMDERAWAATSQVVAEVTAVGGRVEAVRAVLEGRGFEVVGLDRDSRLPCNALLYARKRPPPAADM